MINDSLPKDAAQVAHLNGTTPTGTSPTAQTQAPGVLLLPHHRALIEASGIAPKVAAARPYQSVTDPQRLASLGFAASQCITPALLIPVHNAAGDVATYQSRPDAPRLKDGKPLKYETPCVSCQTLKNSHHAAFSGSSVAR